MGPKRRGAKVVAGVVGSRRGTARQHRGSSEVAKVVGAVGQGAGATAQTYRKTDIRMTYT